MFEVYGLKLNSYDTLWPWKPENIKGDYTYLKISDIHILTKMIFSIKYNFATEMVLGDGSCSLLELRTRNMASPSLDAG